MAPYITPIVNWLFKLAGRDKALVSTGELMVLDHGIAPDRSGRRYLCIYGIVAVPSDCKLQDLHMYPVMGDSDGLLILDVGAGQDRHDQAGMGVACHLTSPMWRI